MSAPAPTFDQLQVMLAVVEEGSFSGAARRLNRAQSAITYAVQRLEEQLGVALFDRAVRPRGLPPGPDRSGADAAAPRAAHRR